MANQKQYWQFEIFGSDADLIGFFGDAGVILPSGTTAERPASPSVGHMRLNTDTALFEGYNGSWNSFGSGSVSTFDSLTDTPVSKVGAGNRVMIVNSPETAIEYSSALTLENTGRLRVPASYEALVDADTVITNKKYVDDNDNLQLSLAGGLMTGGITMGGFSITGLPLTPSSGSEAASKNYVDQIASGIDFKESCHMGTVATFTSIYDNGTAGLGATLTATSPGVLPPSITDDHAHYFVGTRVLVKDQTDPVENGIYEVTDTGTGEEVTLITTLPDVADSLDGTYWTFNDGATSFYVWYSTPAGAPDPAPGGTGIVVAIATSASAEDIKNDTIAAINASPALVVAYDDEVDTFYVVNDNIGAATDATSGTSGFTGSVSIDGVAVGTVWILTRTTDADNSPTNEVSGGMFTFVEDGATLAGTGWVLVQPSDDAVIGVDDLIFTPISSGGGAFLPLAGGTMVGSIAMGAAGIQVIGDVAVPTSPSYSFAGDLGTGLHQIGGPGSMSLVIGTAPIWSIAPTALTPAVTLTQDIGSSGLKVKDIYADHFLPNFGATGDPSYSFEGDATTGMYNDGAGGINFAVGGTTVLGIESDGTISVDTASYETLVLADNDVPNKKYVDDSITAITVMADADGDTSVDVEATADDDFIRFDTGDTPVGYPANTNTMTLASSGFAVALPTANVAATGGAPVNITAGTGGATSGEGGEVQIVAGDGDGSGVGGQLGITAGSGGATGGGGEVAIAAGDGGGTSGYGGSVVIDAGGATDGDGGQIGLNGGTAGGTNSNGGAITGYAGDSVGVAEGGYVNFYAGAGGATGAGGYVKLKAGDAGGGSAAGGAVTIISGAPATSGDGGSIILDVQSGTGAGADGTISFRRDNTEFMNFAASSGAITTPDGAVAGATGENLLLTAGAGHVTSGDGGSVTITAGAGVGAVSGNAGGDITLDAGAGAGAGSAGAVVLPDSAAPSVTANKLYSLAGALNWNGIDLTATPSVSAIVDADADTSVDVETTADDDFIRFDTGDTPANYPANANTMTLASSGWTVALPAANVATAGGAPINLTAGDGNTTGDGGEFIINAGDGGNNGDGGDVLINSGTPYGNNSGGIVEITTGDAPGFGDGGAINLKPGDSNGGGGGGVINLYGGYSTGGDGGYIQIFGGDTYGEDRYGGHVRIRGGSANYKTGGGYGGNVDITGGASTDGLGGRVQVYGGDGYQGGGNVFIKSGGAGTMSNYVKVSGNNAGDGGNRSGYVTVYGGNADSSYASGRVQIQGGTGFNTNNGGELQLYGGPGSPASGTHDTVGGAVTIKGGIGGFTSGNGGAVTITAGSANAGNGDGGKVLIQTGDLSGTGVDGAIEFFIGSAVAFEILGDGTWELAGAPGASGEVLTSNGAAAAPTWQAGAARYTEAFVDGDLASSILTVTHSLGTQFNHVTVYDDSDIIIQPDSTTATSTSVTTIDLTSFGTITGTWNVVVS